MNITIERKWFTPNSTGGQMSLNAVFFCYTLEPRADQSQGKPYCIPAGQYGVTLALSARFQMVTPHVMDVPGFTEIEIHPGTIRKIRRAAVLWVQSAIRTSWETAALRFRNSCRSFSQDRSRSAM